jgi:hypothetical protein
VVNEHDLLGAEQVLGDRQRPDLVIGDHAARVADDVSVTEPEAKDRIGVEPRIHAGDDRDLPGRGERQVSLVEALGEALVVVQ